MPALPLLAFISASLTATWALRLTGLETAHDAGPQRQQLYNHGDVRYSAGIFIGSQPVSALLDTGSYDVVVLEGICQSCKAEKIRELPSFRPGDHSDERRYGSGSCDVVDARAPIAIGPYKAEQDLWVSTRCSFPSQPALPWDVVVGLGPPGKSEYIARKELEKVQMKMDELRSAKKNIPNDVLKGEQKWKDRLKLALTKTALLDKMGVTSFSACFERGPGRPAWLIWNDPPIHGWAGTMKLPVAGDITWSIALRNLHLDGDVHVTLGCEDGCGAVLDTGTSFITVPNSVYYGLQRRVSERLRQVGRCDHSLFPDIVMEVNGGSLRLPPDSYLGIRDGQMNAEVEHFMRRDEVLESDLHQGCQLIMFDLRDERTPFGPMIILGVPFFRTYYTTFDLSTGRSNRSLHFTRIGGDCQLTGPDRGAQLPRFEGDHLQPRRINITQAQTPQWLKSRVDSSL